MAKTCRVLLVEDNRDLCNLLRDVFEAEGYHLAVAENGDAMRAALVSRAVDVVLIDVLLQGENGLELAGEAADAGCAVVLTTGDHRLEKALEASGHRYILKPFHLKALLGVVRGALGSLDSGCTADRGGETVRPPP